MAKFAQYYLKFIDDNLFARLEWANRQDILGSFLETEKNIKFSDKKGKLDEEESAERAEQPTTENAEADGQKEQEPKNKVKIYKHKVYHLQEQPKIIVLRLANVKLIPIEKDFHPETVEHFPSVFILIDNRENCRRVAIQKLQTSFSSTDQVAKILQKTLGNAMMGKCHIGIELKAQRYTMDFYKLWRAQQHHTARLRFNITPDEAAKARLEDRAKKQMQNGDNTIAQREYETDDSIVGHIISLEEESHNSGYRTSIEVESDKGPVMYVDETSTYIKNLVRYSASTATVIELITTDGASFECFIDTDLESDDKIVTSVFEDTSYLEALFDHRLEPEARKSAEAKVLEFVNGMKRVVDDREKPQDMDPNTEDEEESHD